MTGRRRRRHGRSPPRCRPLPQSSRWRPPRPTRRCGSVVKLTRRRRRRLTQLRRLQRRIVNVINNIEFISRSILCYIKMGDVRRYTVLVGLRNHLLRLTQPPTLIGRADLNWKLMKITNKVSVWPRIRAFLVHIAHVWQEKQKCFIYYIYKGVVLC